MHKHMLFLVLAFAACDSRPSTPAEGPVAPTASPTPPPTPPAPASDNAPHLLAAKFNARPIDPAHYLPEATAAVQTCNVVGEFDFYLLATSWAPEFCCGHASKEECTTIGGAAPGNYGATHLTLHGLWPSYSDSAATAHNCPTNQPWPQYCAPYTACVKQDSANCHVPAGSLDPALPDQYAPGYAPESNGIGLGDHEWPKHGGCTRLDAKTFFDDALAVLKTETETSPTGAAGAAMLAGAVANGSGSVATSDLLGAFGASDGAVLLACDAGCTLSGVSFCLGVAEDGGPGDRMACPNNVVTSNYDNGCIVQKCENIVVTALNACAAHTAGTCDPNKGQGPACTTDDECSSQGFLRCAKGSHCCTQQP